MSKQAKAFNKKPVVEESSDADSDIDIVQKKPASNLPAKKAFVKSENHSLKPENTKKPQVKHVGKPAALAKRQAEDSDESDDEEEVKKPVKKAKVQAKKAESSDEEDSDEAPMKQEKVPAKKVETKTGPIKKQAPKAADSDEDSDDVPPPKKAAPVQAKKPVAKKVADSDDENSDDVPPPRKASKVSAQIKNEIPSRKSSIHAKPATKKVAAKAADTDEDDSSEEKPAPKKAAAPAKAAPAKKVAAKAADSDEDDSSDEKPAPKKVAPVKKQAKKAAQEEEAEEKGNGAKMFEENGHKGGFESKPQVPFDNSTEVIVKGLSYNVTEDQIWEHFGTYGTVATVKCLSKDDGSFRGVCFVKFADSAAVDAAVVNSGGEFAGRQLWIEKTKPKGEREDGFNQGGRGGFGNDRGGNRGGSFGGNRGGFQQDGGEKFHTNQDSTVFVGNLTYNTLEDSIWSAFASVGNIKEVRIAKDPEGNVSSYLL